MNTVGPAWVPVGISGASGITGASGVSGWGGVSGISGWSGYSGRSGTSGYSGYSGSSGWSGYSGVAAPAALVAGAGTSAANALYTFRNVDGNGHPSYNINGEPDSDIFKAIHNDNGAGGIYWRILDDDVYYYSTDNVAFPWLVTTWVQDIGDSPVPTVTEVP